MQDTAKSLLKDMIIQSPFGRQLGLEPQLLEPDHVIVAMPFRQDLTTIGDMVHGGAIASLVDVTATAAFWALEDMPDNPRGTTIGFSINYLDAGLAQTLKADNPILP